MADREKLKARFEELKASMEVGLFGTVGMDEVEAVLELIRETEPMVLTVEEIRSGTVEVAWIEDADKAEVIPGIWFRLSNEGGDEAVDIHIRDGFVGARLAVYGRLWRCWTSHPTEEQRKAVKWDAEP